MQVWFILYPFIKSTQNYQWQLKKIVSYEDLSPFSKKVYNYSHPKKQKKFSESKLLPTFHNKNKYTLHYKNLMYYLSKGLILKKIHKIVSFDQQPFLKTYIEKLTKLRIMYAEKNNTFFVNVFKLLANSTYGKFAENPRNYNYSKLCLNPLQFKKAISSPRFIKATIINENVAIV